MTDASGTQGHLHCGGRQPGQIQAATQKLLQPPAGLAGGRAPVIIDTRADAQTTPNKACKSRMMNAAHGLAG